MRTLTYIVEDCDAGRAVRAVAPRRFSLGVHAYRRLKALGAIRVNGHSVHASYILSAGDTLEVMLPSDEADAAAKSPALPGPPSFIRYADEDMLIVSKGAPLATLPSAHIRSDTLREQLAALLGIDAQSFCYHPVNRLDKGTSGLLCVARHVHAQRLLSAQLHTGSFVREYLAVTEGIPQLQEGVIDAPIARLGAGARRGICPHGQRAVTHYRVERAGARRALVRLRLETGRTHQIRVHLASIGCPVCGDYLYGTQLPELAGRFALHSAYLFCAQPVTGAPVACTDPLPEALRALLHV